MPVTRGHCAVIKNIHSSDYDVISVWGERIGVKCVLVELGAGCPAFSHSDQPLLGVETVYMSNIECFLLEVYG